MRLKVAPPTIVEPVTTIVGGATFNLTKAPAYFPVLGANFALIRSTLGNTPSFNYGGTVAENAVIAVSGIPFQVNYNVSGTDLNLKVTIPNNIVYVWDGWSSQLVGDYYQPAPPVSSLLTPPGGYVTFSGTPVTYGYNAYSTIQDAINAVTSGGIIRVYTGTYSQDITVPNGKNNLQIDAWGAAGTRTINGVAGGPSATVTLDGTGTVFAGNAPGDNFLVNQTTADNLAGIRTVTGALGSTISYVSVSGQVNTTAFTGVDVGAGTWVSYSNGSITNYRTGIKVNNGAGSAANPVDIQTSTINGSGWASLTVMPAGVDVGLNGFARITNNNVISGNRWGVRVLGGTAMLQGNNLSNNNWTGASAAGLFVANSGVVDAGQAGVGQLDYTGLGISTGNNSFASGYSMGGAQAIVNLNANFGGPPSGPGNLTDGTSVSARNNDFGTTVYGNIERIVNHAIDNNFQGYVDYRNAVGAINPLQEGATAYYSLSPTAGEVTTQRSMIRGIQFVIDSPVIIDSSAISLSRNDGTNLSNPATFLSWYGHSLPTGAVPLTFTSSVNGTTGRTTVNITFTGAAFTAGFLDVSGGSLVDGLYARNINTSLTDLLFSGSGLKVNNTLGAGGVNAVANANFKRLFGDFNGDGAVSAFDTARFNSAFSLVGSPFARYFDFNNSGVTAGDLADQAEFNKRFGFLLT